MGRKPAKKVKLKCIVCNTKFYVPDYRYNRSIIENKKLVCSHTCDLERRWKDIRYRKHMILVASGKNKNKSHAVKLAWEDKLTKKRHSEAMTKVWENNVYQVETSKAIREGTRKAFWISERKPGLGPHGEYINTKKAGKIISHSHWESFFAYLLDNSSVVETFKKDFPRIGYTYKGVTHTYFPDFYIETCTKEVFIVELTRTKTDKKEQAQIKAANKYCKTHNWDFIVLRIRTIQDISPVTELVQ